MERRKRFAAFLLTLALLLALPAAALAAEYPAVIGAPAQNLEGKTFILHTNDVHGAIDGYAAAAGRVRDFHPIERALAGRTKKRP